MIQIYEKQLCCGCHGCVQICPKKCITMEKDREGFFYPRVDESSCIHCDLCEKVCPVLQAKQDIPKKMPGAAAARNRDNAVRQQSSSGGVFTLLAEQVIRRGGVVFGAAWTENFTTVEHIAVHTEAELFNLRGSKYLQSRIGDSYARAKEYLDKGVPVLFSGTPCQIEGLRRFLQKEYENLLCVDLVCHGVPAPAVWRQYLLECEEKHGAQVKNVIFRDKSTGWKSYSVTLRFENGVEQSIPAYKEPYMRAFLSDACLRPSCHDCRFKKYNRESDLTLADFWGIEAVCPEMDDDRGTSLVLVHSSAGQAALDAIRDQLMMKQVDVTAALQQNPSAVVSSGVHENREAFLENLGSMAFASSVKRWLPRKTSAKEKLYNVLQKLGMVDVVKKLLGRK